MNKAKQKNDFKPLIGFVTVPSMEMAETIATNVVEASLAACVNVIPAVKSFYTWKGEACADDELLLVIKTQRDRVEGLEKRIKELHSYEVPEIIFSPIESGSAAYLDWVQEQTRE